MSVDYDLTRMTEYDRRAARAAGLLSQRQLELEAQWRMSHGIVLRTESNKHGKIYNRVDTTVNRLSTYGRGRITTKQPEICSFVKLGKVCGAEIKKGRRAVLVLSTHAIECLEHWK